MRRRDRETAINSFGMLILCCLVFIYAKYGQAVAITVFVAAIATMFSLGFVIKSARRKRYLNSGIREVDAMTGLEFERFVCAHFQNLGYQGETTPATNDYGADLVLRKDGEKIVVQAKRWREKVGIKAIQEVIGAKSYYAAGRAIVITNSFFTKNAEELANSAGIELWDRKKLSQIMGESGGKNMIARLKSEDKLCPKCGKKMIERTGRNGAFLGCTGFPECRYTESK